MKTLILSATAMLAYLAQIFPPIAFSRRVGVQVLRAILSAMVGYCLGSLIGWGIVEVWLR